MPFPVLAQPFKMIPQPTIIGGSLARMDLPYAKEIFESGIADQIDVLTLHPYNTIPKGSVRDIAYPVKTPHYYLPSFSSI